MPRYGFKIRTSCALLNTFFRETKIKRHLYLVPVPVQYMFLKIMYEYTLVFPCIPSQHPTLLLYYESSSRIVSLLEVRVYRSPCNPQQQNKQRARSIKDHHQQQYACLQFLDPPKLLAGRWWWCLRDFRVATVHQ